MPSRAGRYTDGVDDAATSQGLQDAPRVLIVTTELWVSTARLAMALHAVGCEVVLLGPPDHPALLTGAVMRFCKHHSLRPMKVLWQTLVEVAPQSVIPADERTVIHLQELWSLAQSESGEEGQWLLQLLLHSFGPKEALFAARSRIAVLDVAREENVPIPETLSIDREDELETAADALGFPLVLKADMTSGGDGVAVAGDLAAARRSWQKLHHPPNILRVVRRGVLFKNWAHLRSWAKRERLAITAQRFVRGSERTSMAVCAQGEVVASVCLEVAKTWQVRGPSSVLRVLDDPAMQHAMRAIAKRLGLSGFCGFDFMVPEESKEALLIEMNPRPTQTSHLALGAGRDLVAAYARTMLGETGTPDREAVSDGNLIALFPQELIRDANSEVIHKAYHDVPWDAPALMRRALNPLPAVITEDARWRG